MAKGRKEPPDRVFLSSKSGDSRRQQITFPISGIHRRDASGEALRFFLEAAAKGMRLEKIRAALLAEPDIVEIAIFPIWEITLGFSRSQLTSS